MTALMYIIVFWSIFILGWVIGWIVPEKLVKPFGIFDVYPFKCRKCLTTWMLAAMYITVTILYFNWWFLVLSVIITTLSAIALWYTDINRQMDYDEYIKSGNERQNW